MGKNPEAVQIFNDAMVSLTAVVAPGVLAAYDLSSIGRLYDVGGGFGELLSAILAASPAMRGAVVDLPRCARGHSRQLAEAGVGGRSEFIAADFFEAVPKGAMTIIMKSIIHDWDDERSSLILRNCRHALAEGNKLLLVERIMPERMDASPYHRATAWSDLAMLIGSGGRERTEREFHALLEAARLRMARVIPTSLDYFILEALPR